jgi:hypothetical protein
MKLELEVNGNGAREEEAGRRRPSSLSVNALRTRPGQRKRCRRFWGFHLVAPGYPVATFMYGMRSGKAPAYPVALEVSVSEK